MVINLPNVKSLDLPFEVVADIYKGSITMWNDPAIQRFNPAVILPAEKILVLARQEEYESSTALFTNMLTRMDDEWAKNYGIITGPDFVNGTCCESRKWKTVVRFFPQDIVGVVGLIISVPYTIGYSTRPEIEGYNVTKVSLLENNKSRTPVEPTPEALQLPMLYYVNSTTDSYVIENGTIEISRDNMKVAGAYPMAANSYARVKLSYRSQEVNDCCLIQVRLWPWAKIEPPTQSFLPGNDRLSRSSASTVRTNHVHKFILRPRTQRDGRYDCPQHAQAYQMRR